MNERRFLSLDLLFGHDVSATMYRYLLPSGMTHRGIPLVHAASRPANALHHGDRLLHHQRARHPRRRHARIGAGDVYGYYVITRQYYDRYRLPVMHTETNRTGKHAVEWLWKEWMNLLRLREDGVPIIGFTWFGLVDMKDWDTALTKEQRAR